MGSKRHRNPKVGRNSLCECGSGKKSKKCHGTGPAPGGDHIEELPDDEFGFGPVDPGATRSRDELRPILFDTLKRKVRVCLPPGGKCDKPPINAHSVQNATVLEELAEDGHVVMPSFRLDLSTGPRKQFERVGRNRASTFPGLCAAHDSQVFRAIDTQPLDLGNQEQLLLLAYRAIVRELNALMSARARVSEFNFAKNPTAYMSHVAPLFDAYELYEYKNIYDAAVIGRDVQAIEHHVTYHPAIQCHLAVNSAVSDGAPAPTPQKRMALNVFPMDGGVAVVLSYPRRHGLPSMPLLAELVASRGRDQLFVLSRFVLQNCENLMFRPSFWEGLGGGRQEKIQDFFAANLLDSKTDNPDPDLNLFE